ncbi:MAG: DUF4241 domain-containing protein [Verrucomicrobiae bacterium]|nr:DUF4241 domain-containing protein [Verrucomicrobiae bacterium]
MNIFKRIFGTSPQPPPKTWPNHPTWGALKNSVTLQTEDGPRFLWTVECGDLSLPSGRLVACDPFVFLSPSDTPFILAPKGRFPVVVTLADVSDQQDRSHIREAYASIIFSREVEACRKSIPLAKDGEARPEMKGDDFVGFGVDAGTACFVDESVIGPCMPDPKSWHKSLFENDRVDSWFHRMDDPAHIREGIANITLPLAKNGENLILFHSGWGDGVYPVIGSFDPAGHLLAAHIDFLVLK